MIREKSERCTHAPLEARLTLCLVHHFLLKSYTLTKFIHRAAQIRRSTIVRVSINGSSVSTLRTFSQKTRREWLLSLAKGKRISGRDRLFVTFVVAASFISLKMWKFSSDFCWKVKRITFRAYFTSALPLLGSYAIFNQRNCYSRRAVSHGFRRNHLPSFSLWSFDFSFRRSFRLSCTARAVSNQRISD